MIALEGLPICYFYFYSNTSLYMFYTTTMDTLILRLTEPIIFTWNSIGFRAASGSLSLCSYVVAGISESVTSPNGKESPRQHPQWPLAYHI